MTRAALLLPLVLLAAACASPRESCIAQQTRDLRVVEALIAEQRATLERGYGLREEVRIRRALRLCTGLGHGIGRAGLGTSACFRPEPRTELRPVAVDLDAVRSRLAQLEAKREELGRRADPGVRACWQAYPEDPAAGRPG